MKTHLHFLIAFFLAIFPLHAARQATVEMANFDARPRAREAPQALIGQRLDAASDLGRKIPGIEIELDAVTAAPSWIRSSIGFLTGPDAGDPVVPLAGAARGPQQEPPDHHRSVKRFLDENAALFGHGSAVLDGARVSREFVTAHNGMRTVVWEQQLDGIAVFESLLVGHITRNGALVSLSSRFVPDAAQAADAGLPNRQFAQAFPLVTAQQAIANAATNIGETLAAAQVEAAEAVPDGPSQRQKFRAPGLLGETRADLVWLPIDRNTMQLCWRVILTGQTRNEMFQVLVDTQTGNVQVRHSWTFRAQPATFRVFGSDSPSPFSPGWSTPNTNQPALVGQTNITLTALSTNASPNGWVNTNPAILFFTNATIGNNVDAHTDLRGSANLDYGAIVTAPDLPRPLGTLNGSGILEFLFDVNLTNQPPATNFPARNQDAAVVNAFYWANWMHDRLYDLGFTEAAGNYQQDNFGHSGAGEDAVLVDLQDGHPMLTNNGHIVAAPIDGMAARLEMGLFFGSNPDRDGALDQEWLLHEYTHLMSTRLVGHGTGISGIQSSGLSEGWSDFFALSLLAESGEDTNGIYAWGAYASYLLPTPTLEPTNLVENYYYGNRPYPYTPKMTNNPVTLGDARELRFHPGTPLSPFYQNLYAQRPDEFPESHALGQIWCSTLWEARAIYISKYGFSNGTDRILRLVVDGMKLGPANPTFLQARDAILLADRVTGGVDQTNLWMAFAKRGMGWSAICPSSDTTDGIIESFDMPPPDRKLWAFLTGNIVDSSPAIGPDGTIYVGSKDSKLYAINPDGTLRWSVSGTYSFDCSPAVGLDGTVYMGANDGYLRAVTNGVTQWANYLGGAIFSSPAIGSNGTIFVGVQNVNSNVVAFSPSGTRLWAAALGTSQYVYSSPAIGSNGTLYIGCMDGKVYALNATNGQVINSSSAAGDGIYSSPAIAADGSVYVGSKDGKVYAFDAGLNLKSGSWPFNTGSNIYSSPVVAQDGTIYIGSDDTRLYSLNPNGSQRWSLVTGGRVRSTPAIGADGTVFFGSYDWRMFCVATNGTTNWTYYTGFNIFSSPVIGANGVLYVGSADSKLYALPANTYMAPGAWPCFRRNLRHTADVGTLWLLPGFWLPPNIDGFYEYEFQVHGQAGLVCQIETSADLTNWTTHFSSNTLAAGVANFRIEQGHVGYYRAKSGGIRSLNALGMAVVTSPPSPNQILLANPFKTPNDTVWGIIADPPEATKVTKWNEATQALVTNTFTSGHWSDLAMTLRPGEGAYFRNPLTRPSSFS